MTLSRAELIACIERIRAAVDEEEIAVDLRLYLATAVRPDAEALLAHSDLSPAHVAAIAVDYESIEVHGMTIPLWRNDDGTRWMWFTDPGRTALHWLASFADPIRRGAEYADQGFAVLRGAHVPDPAEAAACWREWTGRDLGEDVYTLAPAWSRPASVLRPARDRPLVAPRVFLVELLERLERGGIHSRGGSFGR